MLCRTVLPVRRRKNRKGDEVLKSPRQRHSCCKRPEAGVCLHVCEAVRLEKQGVRMATEHTMLSPRRGLTWFCSGLAGSSGHLCEVKDLRSGRELETKQEAR